MTDDGAETDLDLGHYERFLGVPASQANNVTTGRIYYTVITREREGAYLGKTVQIVPHITDEIKRRMLLLGQTGKYDVVITAGSTRPILPPLALWKRWNCLGTHSSSASSSIRNTRAPLSAPIRFLLRW